jgi:hypothetical protein
VRDLGCKSLGLLGNFTGLLAPATLDVQRTKNRWRKFFVSFLPAISAKAAKEIRQTIATGGWRPPGTAAPGGPGELHQPGGAGLAELLRTVLPLEVHSGAPAFQRGPRTMGATEVQAVQKPRTCIDALAGTHRATGPQAVCLMGTRRAAGRAGPFFCEGRRGSASIR